MKTTEGNKRIEKSKRKKLKRKLKRKSKRLSEGHDNSKERTSELIKTRCCTTSVYYSIYRGWSIDYTACFHNPVFALIWCRWMLWKDLVLHVWYGKEKCPKWHSCIGRCNVISEYLTPVTKHKGIWGVLTKKLFDGVNVMKYDRDVIFDHKILCCSDEGYNICLQFFKSHSDYQQSAGSIFKGTCGRSLKEITEIVGSDNWKQIEFNNLMVIDKLDQNKFLDIGKSARNKLKYRVHDRNGGKCCCIQTSNSINVL